MIRARTARRDDARRQGGFGTVEWILVVGVIAVISVVTYLLIWHNRNETAQTEATKVPAAPSIETTSDLDAAEKALNQTNVDAASTDGAQLDALGSGF